MLYKLYQGDLFTRLIWLTLLIQTIANRPPVHYLAIRLWSVDLKRLILKPGYPDYRLSILVNGFPYENTPQLIMLWFLGAKAVIFADIWIAHIFRLQKILCSGYYSSKKIAIFYYPVRIWTLDSDHRIPFVVTFSVERSQGVFTLSLEENI